MALIPDDLEHSRGIGSLLQRLAEFGPVEEFGDVGEGMEVFLKLALGNEEKHDQIDGLIVEGVKIDAIFGTAESANDLINEIGRRMGNADAKPDAGAHRGLAFFDHRGDGVVMLAFDFARRDQIIDKFINGFPAVGGVHAGNNLLWAENIA